jgi:hypothetical protein
MKLSLLIIAIIFVSAQCSAVSFFEDSLQTTGASVTFQSDRAGVKVYDDTLLIGTTPFNSVQVEAGTHIFRYVHPEERSWLYTAIRETVTLAASEQHTCVINFPVIFHITSEPYGAMIRSGDSVLGQTPLLVPSDSVGNIITLMKDGYETAEIPLYTDQQNIHIKLVKINGALLDEKAEYLSGEPSHSNTNIYIATGATVVTGIAAVYFKTKADSYYGEYRLTNDPRLLDKVRTYDTVSGISLAASEIGIFVLSYLLLSR